MGRALYEWAFKHLTSKRVGRDDGPYPNMVAAGRSLPRTTIRGAPHSYLLDSALVLWPAMALVAWTRSPGASSPLMKRMTCIRRNFGESLHKVSDPQ